MPKLELIKKYLTDEVYLEFLLKMGRAEVTVKFAKLAGKIKFKILGSPREFLQMVSVFDWFEGHSFRYDGLPPNILGSGDARFQCE